MKCKPVDIDELYAFGKHLRTERNVVEGFPLVEQWEIEGCIYRIGRDYKKGKSILLSFHPKRK